MAIALKNEILFPARLLLEGEKNMVAWRSVKPTTMRRIDTNS
jgi:hypothetical protein